MLTPIAVAATLQLLLAATFLIAPAVAHQYGEQAQRAAEEAVARQGIPTDVLGRHRVKFTESLGEALFPVSIAVCLVALASLNLSGSDVGRILSWVGHAILLVGGGVITFGQVFPARFIESAFRKSEDETARGVDVTALVDTAQRAFPHWLPALVRLRFALTTAGSLLVIVLLWASST